MNVRLSLSAAVVVLALSAAAFDAVAQAPVKA